MAVTLKGAAPELHGLSTDTKPTDVRVNTIFHELDTDNKYYFSGDSWKKIGGGNS